MSKQWFVTLAEERGFQVGDSQYVAHPGCTSDLKAWVYRKPSGHGFYCNKCGRSGWAPKGLSSLRGLCALRGVEEVARLSTKPDLPQDFTLDLPPEALVWLLRAGINSEEAGRHTLGWSPSLRRVILPVYRGRVLVYYQGRALDGREPKYINPRVSKDTILYGDEHLDPTRPVCITEDILSCIRVNGAGTQAVSALGTKLSDYQAHTLGLHPRVFVWLDPDHAGLKGRSSMRKKLLWYPTQVQLITSSRDPKYYTDAEIKEFLSC